MAPFDRLDQFERSAQAEQRSSSNDESASAGVRQLGQIARVNLGIDFGTSYTKVCYRDVGTARSGVIDFRTDGVSEVTASMIPTKVGIISNRILLAGMPEGVFRSIKRKQHFITQLKMRLAILVRTEELADFEYGPAWPGYRMSVRFLASVFLSNVIRLSKACLLRSKADEFRNRSIEWTATVGVPVPIFDTPALDELEHVFETAWLMAETYSALAVDLRKSWEQFSACWTMRCKRVNAIEPCSELGAAVVSLVCHPTAQEGIYLFLDIGGGTLDGVSFRYFRRQGRPRIVVFEGRIGALGIESIVRRHPEWDANEIREAIFSKEMSPKMSVAFEPEADKIRQLVGPVVMRAKDFAGLQWLSGTSERSLPVLLGGGGRTSKFYTDAIMSTHAIFGQASAGIPSYELNDIPLPDDFDMGSIPLEHFHRFAIAYGLSVPFGERPEIRMRSESQPPEPPVVRPITPGGVYDD